MSIRFFEADSDGCCLDLLKVHFDQAGTIVVNRANFDPLAVHSRFGAERFEQLRGNLRGVMFLGRGPAHHDIALKIGVAFDLQARQRDGIPPFQLDFGRKAV